MSFLLEEVVPADHTTTYFLYLTFLHSTIVAFIVII